MLRDRPPAGKSRRATIAITTAAGPEPPAAAYLTRRDLMARYQVSEATLDRLIAARDLPPPDLRLGRLCRWSVAVVTAWERERAASSARKGGGR